MNVVRSIADLASLPGPIYLGIGVFDGVHLGHQAVIGHTLRAAESAGGTPVALTFDPHPATILRPGQAPPLLTSTRHKLRLLGELGVRQALIADFTASFAATPPEEFVRRLAESAKPLSQICVGENWAFGKGRKGSLALLRALGDTLGFKAVGLPAVVVDGTPVSSTATRAAVEGGNLVLASRFLGREFSVLGTVTRGRKLGHTLGFPTANLRLESEQLPPDGVYSVRVLMDGVSVPGVANIGLRPTVVQEVPERVLEVHIFDFSRDIYGQDLEVAFQQFLRPEQKFPNLDALRAQIAADIVCARSLART